MQFGKTAVRRSDTVKEPVLFLRLAQDLHHALPANLLDISLGQYTLA